MRAIPKAKSLWLNTFVFVLTTGLLTSGVFSPATAQVTSDSTTNTIVNLNGNSFTILNGIEKGNNLFHSFSNFSVPTGGSATFDLVNTPNITNIFNRVTGRNISNIDGLIRTANSANQVSLFLMNPNGIIFGQNARLDISGSFVGTTANSIKFADGVEFSATNPTPVPLLTINTPIGLQLGTNPGGITVQGTGHTLTSENPLIAPLIPTGLHNGLAVQPGSTLALVGGKINLNGGVLTAPDGRVELGSVTNGTVRLISEAKGIRLNYEGLSSFDDIRLSERSLIDVNAINAGSIQVQGREISLTDGSVLWAQNRGNEVSGEMTVNASSKLTLSGTNNNVTISSGLVTETVGMGVAGNITVTTPQLVIQSGGKLSSRSYSTGSGGDLTVKAETLLIEGYSPLFPDLYSVLGTITLGSGKAGNVSVSTQNLSILDGGYLGSSTLSNGQGGNVIVNADTIAVRGVTPAFVPSVIAGTTLGRSGNAGNLTLNTRTLALQNSGLVTTSSIGVGSAGDLTVNASESVEISGKASGEIYSSVIASTVDYPSVGYREAFGLLGVPIGASGNVVVNTPLLKLSNYGAVTSANLGIGNAGIVQINADNVQLRDSATISAITSAGEGGNVQIQAQNLILKQASSISATAGQEGNGGNIRINAPIIVGLDDSDIVANAVQGRGGNITISTQGIIGLQNRDRLTPDSDITASSEFGVNGTVDIKNFGVDPSSGLVELPVNLVDSSQQIATGCSNNTGSSFVATGRGGIPQNPTQQVTSERTWSDIRDISAYRSNSYVTVQITKPAEVLVEATSWRRNELGKIELVADVSNRQTQQILTCAAIKER
ncbi:MAG: S-layer family protein [Scytonematopsis contorta HA4267-MV1]|jgi:filamentous hemagglutinin family protein|nr:S-layer family protein [Scytonematopsis contorta HA4267-MV1]